MGWPRSTPTAKSATSSVSGYSSRKALKEETLQSSHDQLADGNLGTAKTLNKLKHRVPWPKMSEALQDWCRSCEVCAQLMGNCHRAPLG